MNEGWYGDEYLVLFTQAESDAAAARYSLARRLGISERRISRYEAPEDP
jgi:hypothetical protein